METNQTNLFELQVDELSSGYLKETAKWAKFLAILGFIGCGLLLLGGIALVFTMSAASMGGSSFGMYSSAFSLVYLALAALYFFPCYYLYRFASGMQLALQAGEAIQLQTSFRNLKSCFRFIGILTIILIAVYLLAIFGFLAFGLASL